ncbi:hypothetical protein B0I35DRAFT_261940 [Stachybotrys elegans]|uniref:Uncharacterized protein n=1 Tax=Stachybotrys elegans TaxID=80388 RepID=A0A8K0WPZ0_9HYPO|nr:hypothetical protein B0I35DRAFT_261940 [Stachybotrys elegans]
MSEEPSLPRLPPNTPSLSNKPLKRTRAQWHGPSQAFNSSDPAFFSSDDDPGLDNYTEGRRKKRYVGSWFQQQPASADSTFGDVTIQVIGPKPKRTLARQVDSGVYLGSDGVESDIEIPDMIPAQSRLPQLEQRPRPARITSTEAKLQAIIRECIDAEKETVDGWSLGLEEISDETISLLSQITYIPQVTKDVAFQARELRLGLLLANNLLTRLPGSLFDVSNLTVLSLRGNNLTDIPPSIYRLQNLQELNVSQNKLRHLPAELLDLTKSGTLRLLVLHPNPLLQPATQLSDRKKTSYTFISQTSSHAMTFATAYLGRSPLQISTSAGRVISDFSLGVEGEALPVDIEGVEKTYRPTAIPSLFELALRRCYSSSELPLLRSYLADDIGHVAEAFDRLVEQKKAGGLTCSRCRKIIATPVLEWVEWRIICDLRPSAGSEILGRSIIINEGEAIPVPLLHRACSWRCGPKEEVKLDWGGFDEVEV